MSKTCNSFLFGTTRIFGVVVESQNSEASPQYAAEAKNEQGETVAVQLGKRTGSCTVSGYKLSGSQTPGISSTFELDGQSFFVDKVSVSQSNSDFQKIEITGKFWDGVATVC